jgi:hypothetical protein
MTVISLRLDDRDLDGGGDVVKLSNNFSGKILRDQPGMLLIA